MGLFFQSCKDYVVPTLICPRSKQELPSVSPCPESTVMSPPPRQSTDFIRSVCLSVCFPKSRVFISKWVRFSGSYLDILEGKIQYSWLWVTVTCCAFVLSWNCAFSEIFSLHPAGIPLEWSCYCLQFTHREKETRKAPQVTIQITDSSPNVLEAKIHPFKLLL